MNIDMDEIDDGGLRFSEENYYHQLSSDGEDSENENVVEDLDDVRDDETNMGEKGDCENEKKWVESEEYGDELTDEVTNGGIGGGFDSEWLSLLQGKNMKMLRLEDVKDIGFTSVEEAEQFYSYYSFIVGFSTKRYKIEKRHVKGTEVIFRRAWACSKEGHCKTLKNKKQVPVVLKVGEDGNEKAGIEKSMSKSKKKKDVAREIKYTRTGCLAVMYVKRDKDTGKYHVSKFATEHNHGLACISERHFLRSHRHVSVQDIAEVLALQEAQVSTSAAYDYLVNQAGGREFVGFMLKDLYNKMDANRKLNAELGDAEAAMNWLKIKGQDDPLFFCRYTKDGDGRLANLFWRDHGSLMDYEAYGDVLIIDSTYKTNIYGMPLVLFVGANNHRASVVFACALVSDEKEDTFTWVIEKFLASMKNNPPKSVVTDGDEAMRKVLSKLMPEARPRLCAWHIGRNVCQNVHNEEVQKKVGKMIYASHTIGEWEEAWQSLIVEYGLENNTWMSSLYAKRERWAEAFCKGHFYGGMCSTQRCEGMNSKLKKRVGRFTRLLDFISRIYRCIDRLAINLGGVFGGCCLPVSEFLPRRRRPPLFLGLVAISATIVNKDFEGLMSFWGIGSSTDSFGQRRKQSFCSISSNIEEMNSLQLMALKRHHDSKMMKGDSPEGEGGTFNMYGGTESTIVTGCNPKEFKRVVSRISNERIILISEMGFGPVHNFRCGELNLSLCEMLLNNFDVKNQTIQIHGRHMSITEKDLGRSMGVRCRGTEVDIDCSTAKLEAAEWKKRLCGNDADINLKSLKKTIVYTDDDELFMVSFALFALATMFCPSTPGYVDPRLLIPLRNPHAIRSHNWGQFAYTKLVEGVASYQSGNPSPNLGCLVFLQVFYLSVLGERMLIVPRCSLPVMAWGVKESNRVFERVKELGGFNARQGVWVTKRFASFGASEYSGSRDKSTGLKTNLFDDTSDLKKELAVVEDEIGSLESIFSGLRPDIAELRRAITSLHRVVVKREAEPSNSVVNEPLEKTTREVIAQMRRGKPRGMMFGSVANISPKEGELLRYVFSQKGSAEDIIGSDEVGRYMEVTVSRYHLNCLIPKQCLNSEVINIMGAYIFGNSTVDWFLPTYFSERAKEGACYAVWEAHLSATITLCGLRKYFGRLVRSEKIFIPILDTVAKHWILAVVKVSYGDCEIWDSNPEVGSEQRRKDYVIAAIDLLLSVFAAELRESPWVCSEAASFTFFYPACCTIQVNDFDSGICVIRNMQFYDQRWHEGFNSGDQRMRIALEIVNSPLNECRDAVWESVYQEQKNVSNSQDHPGSDTTDPLLIRAGMKFKPRVPRR